MPITPEKQDREVLSTLPSLQLAAATQVQVFKCVGKSNISVIFIDHILCLICRHKCMLEAWNIHLDLMLAYLCCDICFFCDIVPR